MREKGQATIEAVIALSIFIIIIGAWLNFGIGSEKKLEAEKETEKNFEKANRCSQLIDSIYIEDGLFEINGECSVKNGNVNIGKNSSVLLNTKTEDSTGKGISYAKDRKGHYE